MIERQSQAMAGNRPALPFHGILPRGAIERSRATKVDWTSVGAALELAAHRSVTAALVRSPRRLAEVALSMSTQSNADGPGGVAVEELSEWIALAQQVRLMTHAEGGRVVRRALRRWGLPVRPGSCVCVKEGHTASVWRVPATAESPELALMVPRDEVAAAELESTTNVLVRLAARRPSRVAETWRVDTVGAMTLGGVTFLPVVAATWVVGSRELHLFAPGDAQRSMLLPVDEFVFGERRDGLTISASTARGSDSQRLWRDLIAARVEMIDLPERRQRVPEFEVNDGDFVESGGRVVAVACSGEVVRDQQDALFDVALTSGFDDSRLRGYGGRLRPDPEATVDALALALRRVAGEDARGLLADAARVPLARRLRDFGPREGRAAVERCQRALQARVVSEI